VGVWLVRIDGDLRIIPVTLEIWSVIPLDAKGCVLGKEDDDEEDQEHVLHEECDVVITCSALPADVLRGAKGCEKAHDVCFRGARCEDCDRL